MEKNLTTILLVRHGESTGNRERRFVGHTDADLTEKGVLQAKATAEYIARHYRVDYVYASDLTRAYRTGKAIADACALPIEKDSRLREVYAGIWENMIFDELAEQYTEPFRVWTQEIGVAQCTGGESVKELTQRVLNALTDIAQRHPGKTVAVACHGTPIRAMQCVMSGQPLSQMKDIPWVSNASVTEIVYDQGTWRILSAGYDAHLPVRTVLPDDV